MHLNLLKLLDCSYSQASMHQEQQMTYIKHELGCELHV